MLLDCVSNLAPTFVGEGCATEVVVTGKGSPALLHVSLHLHQDNPQKNPEKGFKVVSECVHNVGVINDVSGNKLPGSLAGRYVSTQQSGMLTCNRLTVRES